MIIESSHTCFIFRMSEIDVHASTFSRSSSGSLLVSCRASAELMIGRIGVSRPFLQVPSGS
jgi:hypothetical protein